MGRGYTPGEAQRAGVNASEELLPTPPSRRPQFGTRHFVALSEDRPPAPPSKYPEMRTPEKSRSHTDRGRHSRSSPEKGAPPPQQGPVRGKPLIFAAMTSTTEIEDIEPEMVIMDTAPVQEKSAARHSSYAPDERHQTSTPPPEPTPEPRRDPSPPKRNKLQKRSSSSRKAVPPVEEPPERRASAQAPSQPAERSGSSRHRSKRDSVSADPRAQEERHHRSHTSASAETSREHRRRGSSSDASKQQKRHRDGVKVLTDKQMERLNNRTSYAGASGSKERVEQQTRRSYAEEQSPARPPMPQQASHRSSQHYAASAPVPTSHRQTPSPEKPLPQHARHQVPQMPTAQWPEQPPKRPSPPLPTPPEEYNPIPEPRREASPQKAKRLSPRRIEDMEVLAGKGDPSRSRSETPEDEAPYPLLEHLADPVLLENLLSYLSYYEWLRLAAVSKETRRTMYEDGREQVLSRYLQTVGYSTWSWDTPEPLMLSVEVHLPYLVVCMAIDVSQDLNYYMKGVSIPTHSYAAIAGDWLRNRSSVEARTMQELTFACRAFTRVVLRLRAQAEAEATHIARIAASMPPSPESMGGPRMRTLSSTSQRLPAKWASQSSLNSRAGSRAPSPTRNAPGRSPLTKKFHSPLFRLRRAPLLQVFVPSPEGDWLSDASVLESTLR